MHFEPLSAFLVKVRGITPERGNAAGKCTLCARTVADGYPIKFGENFMSYQYLQGGAVICPPCRHMLTTPEYRRHSWLLTGQEFRTLKRLDVLQLLLDPPQPPFAICLTRSGKKHGWIPLMFKVSWSRDIFFVGLDESVLTVRREEFARLHSLAKSFIDAGVFKSEIISGQLHPRSYERAIKAGLNPGDLKPYSRSPIMELVMYVA